MNARGWAESPLAAMARHLRGEESYRLKGVSALEHILDEPEQSARLDAVIRKLRAVKSGLLD